MRQVNKIVGDLYTHPSINPHSQGNPNRKWAATPSARHSIRQGAKASLSTVKDSFRRATGSRPRPARINITVKAIFLNQKHRLQNPFPPTVYQENTNTPTALIQINEAFFFHYMPRLTWEYCTDVN